MKSATSRRADRPAPLKARSGRRARAVGAVVGALAAVSVGFAPGAAAYDAQSKQWYLDAMRAEQMWKVSTGKGIKIAVIDSGVNPRTPALKGQVLTGEVAKSMSYHVTQDYSGHGTSMAELIAGTGAGGGIKGIAPDAKIIPYRIQMEELKDKAELSRTPEPAEAIRAAADSDAKILSMSFGSETIDPDQEAALRYAASKGKLMMAAVGNEGARTGHVSYPAAYPYAVGISSLDESGTVEKTSSYGSHVDLAAPGSNIPSWCDSSFQSYCVRDGGTSSAAALASGAAALVWSVHPDWTANQVLRSLIDTASRTWKKDDPSMYAGYGTVRPRTVLANPDYDAGPAETDPLAKENGGAAQPASEDETEPSTSASDSSQPTQNASEVPAEAAGSEAKSSSSDSNTLWIALGAVAAVIVIGGGGFAVMRARRSQ
ncbi:S8 family serine peptidase [Streptomyces sp. NPDC016845]|uniref:S8 family serine peptidase n=1 Tax=Streptomyces sp. NPDC016845 TaxID=3364972 RepID=UPI0037B1C740